MVLTSYSTTFPATETVPSYISIPTIELVRSPYGGMFAVRIELEPDVPGIELLRSSAADTLLAFEGTLQLKQTFDTRFARDDTDFRGRLDRGKPTRALRLLVSNGSDPGYP